MMQPQSRPAPEGSMDTSDWRLIRYSPAIVIAPPRRPFDFTGNHAVIDFINTVNGRPSFTRDDLASADDLFEWASAAGLLAGDGQVNRTVRRRDPVRRCNGAERRSLRRLRTDRQGRTASGCSTRKLVTAVHRWRRDPRSGSAADPRLNHSGRATRWSRSATNSPMLRWCCFDRPPWLGSDHAPDAAGCSWTPREATPGGGVR